MRSTSRSPGNAYEMVNSVWPTLSLSAVLTRANGVSKACMLRSTRRPKWKPQHSGCMRRKTPLRVFSDQRGYQTRVPHAGSTTTRPSCRAQTNARPGHAANHGQVAKEPRHKGVPGLAVQARKRSLADELRPVPAFRRTVAAGYRRIRKRNRECRQNAETRNLHATNVTRSKPG